MNQSIKALAICGFLLVCETLLAQNVAFFAQADATRVPAGSVFKVEFVLRNAQAEDFSPPDFDGFEIVSGPNSSRQISLVNGARSRSESFSYQLLATKTGKQEIDPATIKIGGATLTTNSLTIEVLPKVDNADDDEAPDLFIRAVIDTTNAYPGQQLLLNYKLYATVNAHNFNILREDRYAEFHYRYVQDFSRRYQTEYIDGTQYRVHTLKSVALFPRKVGTYVIDPFIARVSVSAPDSRRSFFLMTRSVPKTVSTDSIVLNVLPLPEPQPTDFSGAVGRYSMRVSLQDNSITTDDALVLTLDITGDGDARRWEPPDLQELSDRFEVYDPKITYDKSVDEGTRIVHRRTIEYLMLPREAGRVRFGAGFTYFNPDSGQYLQIKSKPVLLDIEQGQMNVKRPAVISDGLEQTELNELISPGKLPGRPMTFMYSPLFFILSGGAFVFMFIVQRRRKKEEGYLSLDPETRRKMEARARALKFLDEAKSLMEASDREYFTAVANAIYSYITAKLNIRGSELTKRDAIARLRSAGVDEAQCERVLTVFNQCEQVMYAGGSADPATRQAIFEDALTSITDLEAVIG